MRKVYAGRLRTIEYLDASNLLSIAGRGESQPRPLADVISGDIKQYGNALTIQYHIAEPSLHGKRIIGVGDAGLQLYYDEMEDEQGNPVSYYDGCDEHFFIDTKQRRYDVLDELKAHVGKYIYMMIEYQKKA